MPDALTIGTNLGHNDFSLLSSRFSRAIQTSDSTEYASLLRIGLLTHVGIAFAGSQPSPPVHKTLLAWVGKGAKGESSMSGTERLDFTILVVLFGVLVAAVSTFSIFTNQIFVSSPSSCRCGSAVAHIAYGKAPVGYSSDQAGFLVSEMCRLQSGT